MLLLKKSNAPLIERFQSPVTYYTDEAFKQSFKNLIEQYYSPIAVFFHHYSLAQKFWEELKNKEEIKLKSYFYLIRSLLSCNWIINDNEVLPMDIEGLMTKIEAARRNELRALIQMKATVDEKYLHKGDKGLNEWIISLFDLLENAKNNLPVNRENALALNAFFLKMINEDADNRAGKE